MSVHFQGARHAYAGQAGKNLANPTAILLCTANMLKHMHLEHHGQLIQDAVEKTIKGGKVSFIPTSFHIVPQ